MEDDQRPVRIALVDRLEGAPAGQRDRERAAHAVTSVANASNASTEGARSFSVCGIEIVQGSPDGMRTPALSWNSHARLATFLVGVDGLAEVPRGRRSMMHGPAAADGRDDRRHAIRPGVPVRVR
jgi:hypothetical protein